MKHFSEAQSLGVLVGLKELDRDQRALDWAARQAGATGRVLTICHVLPADPADMVIPSVLRTAQAERARVLVELATIHARQVSEGIAIERRVERGPVAAVLLSYAGGADEVALGAGGSRRVRRIGTVAVDLGARAPCPVTVVRGGRPDRRVVLAGVAGAEHDRSTLDYAFGYAQAHGLSVQAVRAYRVGPPSPVARYHPGRDPRTAAQEAMRETLAAVGPYAVKYPEVSVSTAIAAGTPADVLVDASAGAELLVVGGSHRHGLGGLLVGSVGQLLIARSACAVTIAR
ncbi:MAG TPA: universal stress protein [Mycobacteriales bacterium]|nr:universal stress protein [Mycobacteriales bacterium]